MAIKDVYELEKAVKDYMSRHRMEEKRSERNITEDFYKVVTMDYDILKSRIIKMKNRKTRVVFTINGKIKSLYK